MSYIKRNTPIFNNFYKKKKEKKKEKKRKEGKPYLFWLFRVVRGWRWRGSMWLEMEMDATGSGACGSWWWRSVAWREEGTFWGEKLLGEYGRCSVFNLVLNLFYFFFIFLVSDVAWCHIR
jgi:hypothetical protein